MPRRRGKRFAVEGQSRTWVNAGIAVFIAYQLVMPLTYYLGDHPYDERFSWRMFSTRRMARCEVKMAETDSGGDARGIVLGRELQVAWINILRRYRPAVVDKFMHRRCEGEGIASVRYVRTCNDTDGTPLPTVQHDLTCDSGELTIAEHAP